MPTQVHSGQVTYLSPLTATETRTTNLEKTKKRKHEAKEISEHTKKKSTLATGDSRS